MKSFDNFRRFPTASKQIKQLVFYWVTHARSQQGSVATNLVLAMLGLGVAGLGAVTFLLPQAMSCGNKAMTAEARNYVGTMNRAQTAYLLEHNRFAKTVKSLEVGIKTETQNYRYSTQVVGNAAFSYGIARHEYVRRMNNLGPFEWSSNGAPMRSYVGGVFPVAPQQMNANTKANSSAKATDPSVVMILCEAEKLGSVPVNPPTYQNGKLACGAGSNKLDAGSYP